MPSSCNVAIPQDQLMLESENTDELHFETINCDVNSLLLLLGRPRLCLLFPMPNRPSSLNRAPRHLFRTLSSPDLPVANHPSSVHPSGGASFTIYRLEFRESYIKCLNGILVWRMGRIECEHFAGCCWEMCCQWPGGRCTAQCVPIVTGD